MYFLVAAILLMLPGIAGVVVPALPGVPFMFVVALGYAVIDEFQRLTGNELAILGGLAVASLVVDYLAGTLGARFSGASVKSLAMGILGLVIGLIILPPLGGILGLFVGIFAAEFIRHKDQYRALKAATGGLIGSLAGIAINLLLAISFLIVFLVFTLRG